MVTMEDIQTRIEETLETYTEYLGLSENDINKGVVGNSTDDEFTSSNKFVRIYTTGKRFDYAGEARHLKGRPGQATILCGWSSTTKSEQSTKSYELAERVERVIIEQLKLLTRDETPIFVFSNDNNMSIHGVTFFFSFDSSAGELPNA